MFSLACIDLLALGRGNERDIGARGGGGEGYERRWRCSKAGGSRSRYWRQGMMMWRRRRETR